ncbi:transcriptional regulator [Fructobacillus sp. M1-13]|uniref:Transcriptional regulator n=1 Tax=Fructobacillus papyriferae TaxID=2713171 RepID=A0ABS5QSP7_9LACO|nr:transcriptional regulator [Fructobacillus papyriferae]MBS9335510.1 transcriptional regulator [Fructobacillus papyriferae]MCD2159280.1 transcriptional regulator [Fructobacillus papyriferae]
MVQFNIKRYLDDKSLTIYRVSKNSGYGYTTIHRSFNKAQSKATSMNVRDLDALAKAQHIQMWQVLRELEDGYRQHKEVDD